MAKYVYPAVFTPEEDGGYLVRFPDVEGCYTDGDSLADALEMANDALCLMLYGCEVDGTEIPAPSKPTDVACEAGSFVSLVSCDTDWYRRYYHSKAVKKTVSLPAWLNEEAENAHLNFSSILQEGLKARLNLNL